MRCRRIVGDVVVELSPDWGTVAVVGLSHLPGDNEIVAVQDLRRAAHRYRTGTGLPGGRLVSGEVAVTTDGARQADVGRLPAATGGAATARVKAVVDAVVVVVVGRGGQELSQAEQEGDGACTCTSGVKCCGKLGGSTGLVVMVVNSCL